MYLDAQTILFSNNWVDSAAVCLCVSFFSLKLNSAVRRVTPEKLELTVWGWLCVKEESLTQILLSYREFAASGINAFPFIRWNLFLHSSIKLQTFPQACFWHRKLTAATLFLLFWAFILGKLREIIGRYFWPMRLRWKKYFGLCRPQCSGFIWLLVRLTVWNINKWNNKTDFCV